MNDETNAQSALPRLASSLTHALQISHTRTDLVDRIGDFQSTTNFEAVQAWIVRQAQQPDFDMTRRLLPLLIDRLEQELNDAR